MYLKNYKKSTLQVCCILYYLNYLDLDAAKAARQTDGPQMPLPVRLYKLSIFCQDGLLNYGWVIKLLRRERKSGNLNAFKHPFSRASRL